MFKKNNECILICNFVHLKDLGVFVKNANSKALFYMLM